MMMEKIMSKTNDTSNLDHRELADSELDVVSGGMPKLHEVASKGTIHPEVLIWTWESLGLTAMRGARSGASGAV